MIKLARVSKTFYPGTANENRSIRSLSLNIDQGDFVTVIGSNGAGKSTMLNLLAGALKPDSGQIAIDQLDVTSMPEYERAAFIGRVFQDPMVGTSASLTIEENLALAMKRKGTRGLSRAVKKRYEAYFCEQLAQLGLGLENRLHDVIGLLSGGQRQSVTLLMAALVKPAIILLDEHTAALDPKTAQVVMDLTGKLVARHELTALMITHNLEHAVNYGNRLIMLHKGEIAFDIKGEERKKLTSSALMTRFSAAATL